MGRLRGQVEGAEGAGAKEESQDGAGVAQQVGGAVLGRLLSHLRAGLLVEKGESGARAGVGVFFGNELLQGVRVVSANLNFGKCDITPRTLLYYGSFLLIVLYE